MKSITVVLFCCLAAVVSAADLEIENFINKSKLNAGCILGWSINKNRKDLGTGLIIAGSKQGEKAFKINAKSQDASFYRMSGIKAKANDELKISAKVKGKGTFQFGYYTYTEKGVYFEAVDASKTFTLTEDFQELEAEFVVKNGAKGQVTGVIRPLVRIMPQGEAIIEDLKIEVDYED